MVKRTNNDLQNTTQEAKDPVTRTPQKPRCYLAFQSFDTPDVNYLRNTSCALS
jgi:hypothetical protein